MSAQSSPDHQQLTQAGSQTNKQVNSDRQSRLVEEIRTQWVIGRELSGAHLNHTDLFGVNLSEANLRGANLSDSNLSCANLQIANLSEANLSEADLSEANLQAADLTDAHLKFAHLRGAHLSDAEVDKARFGYNSGISKEIKRDLIERGAIFEDSFA